MPTDRERLATLETEMKELKRQLAAKDSLLWKIITLIIAAAGSYGAVLSAEIMRHSGNG